ncbi:MAG: recombinase family protein [Firmicutes bacterium]|nr:recombinase family protein [Bacillota bacterium]
MSVNYGKYFDPADKRKIAIYSRKSKFTGKGDSIGNQKEECLAECRYRAASVGVTLSDDDFLVFEDEGFSGKSMNRPGFLEMQREYRNNNIKVIVCYRLDRISRNVGEFAGLIDELEKLNVGFISKSDGFDTVTPAGRTMMFMVTVFSQFEREIIAERIRDNLMALARTGRWLGGEVPTGYESVEVERIKEDNTTRTLHRLGQVSSQIAIVEKIYQLFMQLDSPVKVEAELQKQDVKTKRGNAFTRYAVRDILKNPVYMAADQEAYQYFQALGANIYADESEFDGTYGVAVYNRTKQEPETKKIFRPITEWVVAVGQHKGCISGEDWTKVQTMLQSKSRKSNSAPKKTTTSDVSLLGGLLVCGECGSFMRHKLTDRMHKLYDEPVYPYVCLTKERTKREGCKCDRVKDGNALDRWVCEDVRKLDEDGSVFVRQMEQAKKQIRGKTEGQEKQIEDLRKQIQQHEKVIARLLRSIGQDQEAETALADEYIRKDIAQLGQQIKDKEQQIAELEAIANSQQLSDNEFDLLRGMLSTFASSFDTMSVPQKRIALGTLINRIIWDGKKAHVIYFGCSGEITELPDLNGADISPSDGEEANTGGLLMKSSCTSATKRKPPRMSP